MEEENRKKGETKKRFSMMDIYREEERKRREETDKTLSPENAKKILWLEEVFSD